MGAQAYRELERVQKALVDPTSTSFRTAYHGPGGPRNAPVRDVARSSSQTCGNVLLTAESQTQGMCAPELDPGNGQEPWRSALRAAAVPRPACLGPGRETIPAQALLLGEGWHSTIAFPGLGEPVVRDLETPPGPV